MSWVHQEIFGVEVGTYAILALLLYTAFECGRRLQRHEIDTDQERRINHWRDRFHETADDLMSLRAKHGTMDQEFMALRNKHAAMAADLAELRDKHIAETQAHAANIQLDAKTLNLADTFSAALSRTFNIRRG